MVELICVGVARLFIALLPRRRDYNQSNLVDDARAEAREVASASSTRILLLSWPLLTVASVLARADVSCSGTVRLWPTLGLSAVAMILAIIVYVLPVRLLRGKRWSGWCL